MAVKHAAQVYKIKLLRLSECLYHLTSRRRLNWRKFVEIDRKAVVFTCQPRVDPPNKNSTVAKAACCLEKLIRAERELDKPGQ